MKTVLITGATDGIGRKTAQGLAEKGWNVLIHGRSEKRCLDVMREIRSVSGNSGIEYLCADLSDFENIHKMAEDVKNKFKTLSVLINNAGIFEPRQKFTSNGIELTFAVNHLAGFLLTGLLLDVLRQNTPARIVNVSSMAHASQMDFDNLRAHKRYSGHKAYAQSKLANIMFTFYLAEKLADRGITVNCLHPGVIGTKLLHAGWGMGGNSVEQGAKTSVYLASCPEVEQTTGKYFIDGHTARPAAIAGDRNAQEQLWEISETLCNYSYYQAGGQ